MSCARDRWFSPRYSRFLTWILLFFLLPLPALLEAGHSCRPGIQRHAPSLLVDGREEAPGNPPRLWNGCFACKLLRNLLTHGVGDSPVPATVPVARLKSPGAGVPISCLHPETSLLPRPPPALDPGRWA